MVLVGHGQLWATIYTAVLIRYGVWAIGIDDTQLGKIAVSLWSGTCRADGAPLRTAILTMHNING